MAPLSTLPSSISISALTPIPSVKSARYSTLRAREWVCEGASSEAMWRNIAAESARTIATASESRSEERRVEARVVPSGNARPKSTSASSVRRRDVRARASTMQ